MAGWTAQKLIDLASRAAVEGTVTVTAMNLKWRPAAAGGGRQVNSNTSLCFGLLFFSCRANLVKLRLPNQIYSV